MAVAPPPTDAEARADAGWQKVLEAVLPAVVALQVTAVRSFQDDRPGAHGGTGFVVDAARGLVLTNRHVCTCGPARALATFVGSKSMEELPLEISYVDPAHDFALLRFDPQRLRQTPRAEILLDPSGCRVGEDIRIVGNDSLEKVQILSGTIARVDRNTPDLDGDYQDENTFYVLAGSGTRGGSSGSPVLNRQGRAIALNAAARGGTMHALFLPLQRVARALEAVRAGAPVPRGTLCTAFMHCSFPECLRLGVDEAFVQEKVLGTAPAPGGTFSEASPPGGMLKVHRMVPGCPAALKLQAGDVLLELNGQSCVDFVHLEAALDEAVGKELALTFCRGGSKKELKLKVEDFHSLLPRAFVEIGLGVFHEVPYQTAQKHHIIQRGIYVAQAGFVFGEGVKSDSVILAVNGQECYRLESFQEALRQIEDKEYFSVTWMSPSNMRDRRKHESLVKMQHRWCPFRSWSLDLSTRVWSPRRLEPCRASAVTPYLRLEAEGRRLKRPRLVGPLVCLSRSMVTVQFRTVQNFDLDLIIDEHEEEADVICRRGAGLVIDERAGFVLTDRGTVPQALGDIEVNLEGCSRSASVWFTHPLHSFVLLKVEPLPGKEEAFFGEPIQFEHRTFEPGDEVDFVGTDIKGERFSSKVKVQSVRLGDFPRHSPPRWRERNVEAVFLVDEPPNASSGVLCNDRGHVHAIYAVASGGEGGEAARFGYCIPAYVVLPILEHVRTMEPPLTPPTVPSLEIDFKTVELHKLRNLAAKIRPPAEWIRKLDVLGDHALQVSGVSSNGPCDGILQVGDLVVAVAGELVSTLQSVDAKLVESQAEALSQPRSTKAFEVRLTLLRRGAETEVQVKVPLLGSDAARHMVCWQGLVLQDTPRAVKEFSRRIPKGLYISRTMLGSPAEADGVEGDFLLAVDGVLTPNLEALLEICRRPATAPPTPARAGERRRIRVETAELSGRASVAVLEPDPLYWPTFEILQGTDGSWVYSELDGNAAVQPAT